MISRGPSIEKFFARYLRHPSGRKFGEPFVMENWQRAFTRYFHQLDAKGNRVFRIAILGIPRGNGKSPLAAGFGLYEMMARNDAPPIYVLAASKDQAAIVHTFARAFVESGPLHANGVRSGRKQITYPKKDAFFEVLTTSGLNVHGKNPAIMIGDELHALVTQMQRDTWEGMWSAMHKRDNPYALGITTAGFDKATMLGESYDQSLQMPIAQVKHNNPCLRIHEDRENGILLWWYGIPEELHHDWDNIELWRHANPASWLLMDDLKKQLAAPGFPETSFQRLHLNMWTGAKDVWLPGGVWAALVDRAPLKKGSPVWLGVDVGWVDDSTAVVWAARLPNGKIAVRAKVWTTRPDQVGEFVPGGTMKLELVERFILDELKPQFKIREIAYDPNYFGRSSEILEAAGLRGKMVEMPPWHTHTAGAWEEFKQLAIGEMLSHDGDPVLAAHVAAAGTQMTTNGPRVRKATSGKIDALAAGVLAVSRCQLHTKPTRTKPGVFWMDVDGTRLDEDEK